MIPTDDYAATLTAPSGPVRDLCAVRVSAHRRHDVMMADYYAAREAWETDRAAVALYYATEEREYAEIHPRPLLRDFMRG